MSALTLNSPSQYRQITRVQLDKLILAQQIKKSLNFMHPKVHYSFHKRLTMDPILNQVNPVHTLNPTYAYVSQVVVSLYFFD